MSYRISFYTLGCRVNRYESDAMAEQFEALGCRIVPFGEECDLTVINTCAVTAESDRKSMQAVRRAAKASPNAKIVVAGCSSQISQSAAEECGGVVLVCGNTNKDSVAETALRFLNGEISAGEKCKNTVGDISKSPIDSFRLTRARRARAYIKIEDGCENKCAYCIIPRARGHVRSKSEADVLSEASLIAESCPEIILTGIETASYGRDRAERGALASLLKKTDAISGVNRLTVGSLDPSVLTEDFLETVSGLKSFLPHLHLSLQSGSTSVLRRMRRRYSAESAWERIMLAKKYIPGVFLSADVIVGFPGETKSEFSETMEFFRKARFFHLHIFPFSKRLGTEAADMDFQIDEVEKKERAARLSGMQAEIKREILEKYVAEREKGGAEVLFEQKKNGVNIGHSRHYVEVRVKDSRDFSNTVRNVSLTKTNGEVCFGAADGKSAEELAKKP